MKRNKIILPIVFLVATIIGCEKKANENADIKPVVKKSIYEEECRYPLRIIFPYGPIHKSEPEGDEKIILFNKDKGFKYYIFGDSIMINIKHKSFGSFIYILHYNFLSFHTLWSSLAFIYKNEYGLWLGIEDSLDNIEEFNEAISIFDIAIQDSQQAINYALFYLRISDDGDLTRFYLRSIDDIWLLTQFYFLYIDKHDISWHIKEIQKFDGGYLHANLTRNNRYIVQQPEEFPDYDIVYPMYKDVVHPPVARFESGNFIVTMFVWSRITGDLEKWIIEITPKGKILDARKEIIAESIGHFFKGINLIFFKKIE